MALMTTQALRLARPLRSRWASPPAPTTALGLRHAYSKSKANERSNLEIFKFAVYIFIPIGIFYWFNVPEFQEEYSKDMRERVFGRAVVNKEVPHSLEEAREMRRKLIEKSQAKPTTTSEGS